jgi:lactoylglutathione lyase
VITDLFPIISTRDLDAALGFYRDLLGGKVSYEFPGPDGKPAYVALDLGSGHLGIGRDPDAAEGSSDRFSIWVYAEDCDAAVDRLRSAAVTIVEEPADQPWGERVGRVHDPDGNLVIIGQRAPEDPQPPSG